MCGRAYIFINVIQTVTFPGNIHAPIGWLLPVTHMKCVFAAVSGMNILFSAVVLNTWNTSTKPTQTVKIQ